MGKKKYINFTHPWRYYFDASNDFESDQHMLFHWYWFFTRIETIIPSWRKVVHLKVIFFGLMPQTLVNYINSLCPNWNNVTSKYVGLSGFNRIWSLHKTRRSLQTVRRQEWSYNSIPSSVEHIIPYVFIYL